MAFVLVDNVLTAPVELSTAERAKVHVWRQEGGGLRLESCWGSFRLLECRCVVFVGDDLIQHLQGYGFAASMLSRRCLEAQLFHSRHCKIAIRPGQLCVALFITISLFSVDIRLAVWDLLLEIQTRVPWSGQAFRCRNRSRNLPDLLTCNLDLVDGHCRFAIVLLHQLIRII